MDEEELNHLGRLLREAAKKDRGYASFHDWPNRELKEVGVVLDLFESLLQHERKTYSGLRTRGKGNDPTALVVMNGDRVNQFGHLDSDSAPRRIHGFTVGWNLGNGGVESRQGHGLSTASTFL